MQLNHIKSMAIQYLPLYLLTTMISLWMRHICKTDDSDVILWILAPTARWVSILCGISFDYLPHMGYINHFHHFLIAPACSGIRFMMLTFLMLVFSFLHPACAFTNTKPVRSGWLWFAGSTILAYISTIFVNGIRIGASIYLPLALENRGLIKGWLTPERLHTIIGSAVYFSGLYMIYRIAERTVRHGFIVAKSGLSSAPEHTASSYPQGKSALQLHESFVPVFWYLFVVLIIPFLGRIYRNEWDGFIPYAALILGVCLTVTVLRQLLRRLMRWFRNTENPDFT